MRITLYISINLRKSCTWDSRKKSNVGSLKKKSAPTHGSTLPHLPRSSHVREKNLRWPFALDFCVNDDILGMSIAPDFLATRTLPASLSFSFCLWSWQWRGSLVAEPSTSRRSAPDLAPRSLPRVSASAPAGLHRTGIAPLVQGLKIRSGSSRRGHASYFCYRGWDRNCMREAWWRGEEEQSTHGPAKRRGWHRQHLFRLSCWIFLLVPILTDACVFELDWIGSWLYVCLPIQLDTRLLDLLYIVHSSLFFDLEGYSSCSNHLKTSASLTRIYISWLIDVLSYPSHA
jgi:hypothetical protein